MKDARNFMESLERRKDKRLSLHFPAMFHSRTKLDFPIEGVTENLSQGGAFIKTMNWEAFKINGRAIVTLLLPPIFSGHDETIGLQGKAVVTRIDQANEGIGLQFMNSFKQFHRI